jgi:hypothetical protein
MRPVLAAALLFASVAWASGPPRIQTLDGSRLPLFESSAVVTAVFFVCTDCPVSNGYAPEIQRICASYQNRGTACVLVYEDLEASQAEVRKHLAEYGFRSMSAAIDASKAVAKFAKASVTPEAVIIDRQGTIRYRGRIDNRYAALGKPRQQTTVHDLTDALDAVLSGRPVQNAETKALGCFIVDPEILK